MPYEKKFLMGNEAIAIGAIHSGVNLVAGYPGTPSTEVLETVVRNNDGSIYTEWSVNEKAALEVAAGASYAGARTLVTMKQVGLNVASDPLMSLAYVGVKGGMVVLSADDPGPISSQTEQDTRTFAEFAKIPVFDPSSPEEAYEMMEEAFGVSERWSTPVLFRPTTRVCHGCASVPVKTKFEKHIPDGFVKDTMRWVIFPRTSFLNHEKIEKRNPGIGDYFSKSVFNKFYGSGKKGICTSGISFAYTEEALSSAPHEECRLLKIGTPFPFPEKLALDFLSGLDEVVCIEELDPFLEKKLTYICGKYHLAVNIHGKLDGYVQPAGENSVESVKNVLRNFISLETENSEKFPASPDLPVRPPVLCAGCPHRASFYAVKQAMKGRKAVFSGDIGCYTLGNAAPLDMVDTCLCMGADVTMAQGLHRIEPDTVNFSFIGDSTFFASGITGVVNAVYNGTDIVLIVLDNSTTAMTGHQPHPGTGVRMMGDVCEKVSIEKILRAVGLSFVETVDPLNLETACSAVRRAADTKGVSAIIFRSPCIAIAKSSCSYTVADNCVNCKKCIRELGCPAIVIENGKPFIEKSLCFGCSLCAQVCPCGAIVKK